MNSKELIKKIDIGRVGNGSVSYNDMCLILNKEETSELLQYIEKLEKGNQELKETINDLQKDYDALDFEQVELYAEIAKLKKTLEKACERLDYTCPVEEELIDDLDCENCKDTYKECWKKFFLKNVSEEE